MAEFEEKNQDGGKIFANRRITKEPEFLWLIYS